MRRSRLQTLCVILWFAAMAGASFAARRASERAQAWTRHAHEVERAIASARQAVSDARAGRATAEDARGAVRRACDLAETSQPKCREVERGLAGDAPSYDAAAAALGRMLASEQAVLEARSAAHDRADRIHLGILRAAFFLAFATTLGVLRSLGRRRRAFEEQSAFFASVLESIGDPVVAASPSRTLVVANARAREVFAGARAGEPLEGLLAGDLADADPLARGLAGHRTDGFVFSAGSGDGRAWLCATGRPVHDASGKVLGSVSVYRDVTAERAHAEEVRALAVTDALTGCHNRRGFFMLAEQHARLALRVRAPFTVLFVDLDGLKAVNDAFGHDAGDAAIQATARIVADNLRESDIVARLGGDEFVVLAPQTDSTSVGGLVKRVQAAVTRHNDRAVEPYQLSLSFGAATFDPAKPRPLSEVISEADRRMYRAKRTRSKVLTFSSPSIRVAGKRTTG